MIARTPKDIHGLQQIGRVVAQVIQEMKNKAKPGVTTKELDEYGGRLLAMHGAASGPKTMYDFPGYTCISVNEEIAHGIPGDRKLAEGDLVNIDVSAVLDGYYADAGHSFQLPPYNMEYVRLCQYTTQTMMKVIESLRPGTPLHAIGRMIETEAKNGGYTVIRNLCSHGIGRSLHEEPHNILPFYHPGQKTALKEGQVITIEPFLSLGAEHVDEDPDDGWTLRVPNAVPTAQQEHTIIITKNKPIITTML